MPNRKVALSGFTLAAVALASACTDDLTPPAPPVSAELDAPLFSASSFRSGAPRTLDDEFARIAEELPGFGGMYYDEAGTLNVVMAGDALRMSTAAVASALQAGATVLGVPAAELQAMSLQQGQYDFLTLRQIHSRLGSVFSISGVVYTDVDEVANRVRIGIEEGVSEAQIEQELQRLGVPREAVIISITEPIQRMNHTLRDRVRPVAGGLQINFPGVPGFVCTLGFNVRAPGTTVQGFVTNSHCTNEQGGVENTPYFQHRGDVPNTFIGTEAHDVPFFPCVDLFPGTPPDWRCRFSDAAGVRYAPGVENVHGQIYRTRFPSTSSPSTLEIDHDNERFTITDERPFPLAGDVLNKVGRTSGWTMGPVIQTCINTGVAATNPQIFILCQDLVEAFSAGGDSGSPVFERIGDSGNVRLVGILWGGGGSTFVLSAMANIRFENPGPRPWTTYPGQVPPMP
jgi:hypothetical protein